MTDRLVWESFQFFPISRGKGTLCEKKGGISNSEHANEAQEFPSRQTPVL